MVSLQEDDSKVSEGLFHPGIELTLSIGCPSAIAFQQFCCIGKLISLNEDEVLVGVWDVVDIVLSANAKDALTVCCPVVEDVDCGCSSSGSAFQLIAQCQLISQLGICGSMAKIAIVRIDSLPIGLIHTLQVFYSTSCLSTTGSFEGCVCRCKWLLGQASLGGLYFCCRVEQGWVSILVSLSLGHGIDAVRLL